jgi:hypothetical protein
VEVVDQEQEKVLEVVEPEVLEKLLVLQQGLIQYLL